MRLALIAAALLSTAALAAAQTPVETNMQTSDRWHAKAREIYGRAISFQTVQGRNQSPSSPNISTSSSAPAASRTYHPGRMTTPPLWCVRWPAARPSGRKAILLMAHMDVVEARREDWSRDPFTLGEADGYFYGRGTIDDKQGVTAVTTALLRLRAEGFQPNREIIVLFTGDEETDGQRRRSRRQPVARHDRDRFRAQRRRRRRRLSRRMARCSASASRPPRKSIRASP